MIKLGVYVGRFCPPHNGHRRIVDFMIEECGVENSLVLVGSSNHVVSYRHLFQLDDRITMIRQLFPKLNIAGIPDYETDELWMADLWATVACWRHNRESQSQRQVTFYGGCEEDILFFIKQACEVSILNHFDGSGPTVSATEVRDALVHGRSIQGLVPDDIVDMVHARFKLRWEQLKLK